PGQLCRDLLYIADAHPCIEQQRSCRASDQVANRLLSLVRFINGKHSGCGLVDFKPRIADGNAFESLVFRTRKSAAPTRDDGLGRSRGQRSTKNKERNSEPWPPARNATAHRFTTSGTRVAG